MGTHRKPNPHVHGKTLLLTATAGGLLVTGITQGNATVSAAPAGIANGYESAVAHQQSIVEVADEDGRRSARHRSVDSEELDRDVRVRAQRGRHARPQLAPAAVLAKAKAKTTAQARAKAKTTAHDRAPAATKQVRASRLPINGKFRITSSFAGHAGRMKGRSGGGIDYAIPTGTPVYATHAGKVLAAGRSGSGYGTWVSIDYGRGYRVIYAHLSRAGVKRGDVVRAGELLGRSGSTGNATGPHLHYELRRNGASVDPRKVDLSKLGTSPV